MRGKEREDEVEQREEIRYGFERANKSALLSQAFFPFKRKRIVAHHVLLVWNSIYPILEVGNISVSGKEPQTGSDDILDARIRH